MADKYVAPSSASPAGNNANSGAEGAPWLTFNYAGTQLSAGDTLYVRGGTYAESVLGSNFPNGTDWTTGAVNVTAYPSETVWIQKPSGGGNVLQFSGQSYHIWTGIGIDGINMTGTSDGAIYFVNCDHVRFQDAEIKDANWSGIHAGREVGDYTYIELLRLVIHDGGRVAAGSDAAHGIYFSAHPDADHDSHILIEDVEVYGFDQLSNNSGIQLYGGSGLGGGITIRRCRLHGNSVGTYLSDAGTPLLKFHNNLVYDNINSGIECYTRLPSGLEIFNNTIHSNGGWGIIVGGGAWSSAVIDVLIKNNAITDNSNGPIIIYNISASSKATIQYNDLNGNGSGNAIDDQNNLSTISNNITSAPSYVSAPTNLSLQSGSALRDAGTNTGVTDDYVGVSRPQNSLYDIGAYEYLTESTGTVSLIGVSSTAARGTVVSSGGGTISLTGVASVSSRGTVTASGGVTASFRYVSPTGNNNNSGTINSPWLTFNYAGTQLLPGDTLYVRGGTYAETVLGSNFPNGTDWTTGAVNISAYPSETVWVQPLSGGGDHGVGFSGQSYQIWTGINIDGISTTTIAGSNIYITGSDHIRYQDAELKNSNWSGVHGTTDTGENTYIELLRLVIRDGGRVGSGADGAHGVYITARASAGADAHFLIEGCDIYGFHHPVGFNSGIQVFSGSDYLGGGITIRGNKLHDNDVGSYLAAAGTPVIQFYNNLVYDNINAGIELYSRLPSGVELFNNTIHSNGYWGIVIGAGAFSAAVVDVLIKNNAITDNGAGPIRIHNTNGATEATIQFNAFNGNGNGNIINDENSLSTISDNITSAPSYVNAPTDLSLQSGSALRDAGTNTGVAYDYVGIPRPQNSFYDIGAFEYTTTSTVAITGVSATGARGTVIASRTTTLVGQLAISARGTVTTSSPNTANLTGVTATASRGSVSPSGASGISALTGVAGTSAGGSIGTLVFYTAPPGIPDPVTLFIDAIERELQPGWDIRATAKGNDSLSCRVFSADATYRPALDKDIVVEHQGERIFGGICRVVDESGIENPGGTPIMSRIAAVSFDSLATQRYISITLPAGTLKAALQALVPYLSTYGVTLDPAQVDGPSLPELVYDYRQMNRIFEELVQLTNSTYVQEIDYYKVLRMYPIGSIAAPFNIAPGDGNTIGDIHITRSRVGNTQYANRVIVRGGTPESPVTAVSENTTEQALNRLWEEAVSAPTATDVPTAQALADAILAQRLPTSWQCTYPTMRYGLKPGMTQTINAPSRNFNNSCIITEVQRRGDATHRVIFSVTAVEGYVLQDTWRSTYQQWSGGPSNVFSIGGAASGRRTAYFLGGSAVEYVQSPTPTWIAASGIQVYIDTVARGTTAGTVYVRLRATSGSVMARLQNITDGVTVGTSSVVITSEFENAQFTVSLTPGNKLYELQVLPSAADVDVAAIGYLE